MGWFLPMGWGKIYTMTQPTDDNLPPPDPFHTPIDVWEWDSLGKGMLVQMQLAHFLEIQHPVADQAVYADWLEVDWIQAAQTYRQEIMRLYGSLHIFGMSGPVPLTNLFTDVYLLDKPSALRQHTLDELKRQPLDAALRHEGGQLIAQHRRLFILGQLGSGKTTFLKHLALQAAQNQFDAIPIFVSLKDWSDTSLDLIGFLVRRFAVCSFPDAWPFIESILSRGRAIVLFDGLDEVPGEGERHQRIIRAIHEFAQQYGKSQIVITCRTAAPEPSFEQFTYCEVADFTQAQIEVFVGRWFQQNDLKRGAFLNALAQSEHERLRDLARRPLLLTMLCLTFDETLSFPQHRAALYEEAIDALLRRWDSSRSIQRDTPYRRLSLGHKRQLFTELASESFDRDEFFIPQAQLAERIERFIRRLPRADQGEEIDGLAILRAIEAQHGLLIARARGIYSFSHMTFHEYFAARHIVENPDGQVLSAAVAQATNGQWREVLLLISSMLGYRKVTLLFQIWSQQLQAQLRETPPLAQMMAWVGQQAAGNGIATRAAIVTITMIDQAVRYNQKIARDLDRASDRTTALASDIAHARDLARNLTSNLARDLARARTLDHVIASARDLASDLANDCTLAYASDLAGNLASDLARAHDLAIDLTLVRDLARARTLASDLASNLARARALDHALARDLASNLARARDLARARSLARDLTCASDLANGLTGASDFASASTSARISARFTPQASDNQLPPIASIPQQNWQLSEDQLNALGAYLSSTELLLECLDLAAVEDRQAVLDCLLVPPEQ
jgi:hypothetical protein